MNTPTTTRESILEELKSITLMRRGTLTEQFFTRRAADGREVRHGPYYKFQIWQDGRNHSRSIPADEAAVLREDINNYHRFEQLCGLLAKANIEHTIARRAADTAGAEVEKKTSRPNASPKNIAKRNTSSTKRAKSSPKDKGSKT